MTWLIIIKGVIINLIQMLFVSIICSSMSINLLTITMFAQASPKLSFVEESSPAAEVVNIPVEGADNVLQFWQQLLCVMVVAPGSRLRYICWSLVQLLCLMVWRGILVWFMFMIRRFWLIVGRLLVRWRLMVGFRFII